MSGYFIKGTEVELRELANIKENSWVVCIIEARVDSEVWKKIFLQI